MKKIFITVLFFNFFTCKEKSLNHNFEDNIKRNTYDILKVLYDDIIIEHTKMTVFQPLPPPPPNSEASLDSLFKIIEENRKEPKDTIKEIRKQIRKFGRRIVAIDTVLDPLHDNDLNKKYLHKCLKLGFEDIYYSFKDIKDSVNIDITKIPNNEYSYILPYQTYYKGFPRRGFDKYNMVIKFSRVALNEKKNKASVIMGVSFGRLNGFSAIYFLEKKNSKWIIKCKKGLSIS